MYCTARLEARLEEKFRRIDTRRRRTCPGLSLDEVIAQSYAEQKGFTPDELQSEPRRVI